MASYFIRKDSPFYWVKEKRADGSWSNKSSGIRHGLPGAVRRISQYVATMARDEEIFSDDGNGVLLKNWVPQFIERHCSNVKIRIRYVNSWANLSQFLKEKKALHPAEVTYGLVLDYLEWRTSAKLAKKNNRRTSSRNTAIYEVKVLGLILNEAVRLGYIYANPIQRMGLKKDKPKEKREITRDEEEAIWSVLKDEAQWMRDCWVIAMKQGCRLSEVQVPLKQVDFESDVIRFNTKGGRVHDAPMHRDVRKIAFRRQREGEQLLCVLPQNASKEWSKFFDRLGMPELSFHCTRVTVVTRLARAGFSQAQTMQYVGHASEVIHSVYRKLKAADVKSLGDVL